jgi:LAO/AO transport system kinase
MTKANGWFGLARRGQTQKWMHEIIRDGLKQRFESHPSIKDRIEALEQDVLEGRTTSFRAARELLETYSESKAADR